MGVRTWVSYSFLSACSPASGSQLFPWVNVGCVVQRFTPGSYLVAEAQHLFPQLAPEWPQFLGKRVAVFV